MPHRRLEPRPDPPGRRTARVLLVLSILLGCWAIVAVVSGGLRLRLAGVILSSRNPVRPALLAVLLAVAAWRLDPHGVERWARRAIARGSDLMVRLAAPVAVVAVLAVTVGFGGRGAIGADSFGYISQSVLWLRGDLRIDQPFAALMPWPEPDWTLSPLGYRPAAGHILVPTYAPGLPLLMAGARLISQCAPYYIVPACAALLVLFTWLLGRRVFGAATGIAGTLIVAASPVVLSWAVTPMTDVPVATFWIAALLAADRRTMAGAVGAGALSGIAILIRPNLAPLALFPLLLTMVHGGSRRAVLARAGMLAGAVAPFALFVGVVHNALYGSPLTSGYGDVSSIYSLRNFAANVRLYPAWWWETHGIIGWLFVVGMFRPRPAETWRRALILMAFALAVGLSYAFYLPFEHWGYLRFMLSAVPIALLLSADAVVWLSSRFGSTVTACSITVVTAIAILQGIHFVRWNDFFSNAAHDQRYVDAGVYIDAVTPANTIVLAMQHSGSVRYYSGRLTLRYDILDPAWLDRSLDTLEGFGFSSYALLEEWEEGIFRQRFGAQAAVRALDAGPIAVRRTPGGELRLFALRAPEARGADRRESIPHTSRFDCRDASPAFATTPPGMPVKR